MLKTLLTATLCTTLITLNACGGTSETEQQPVTESIEETEATSEKAPESEEKEDPNILAVGETRQTELGEMTLVKKLDVKDTFETGAFKLDLSTISVANIETNETSKSMFDGKDRVTLLAMGMDVENTSPDTLSFHPNQATIVAGKEQKTADLFMSENIGGEFIGEVIKSGKVLFVLDTPAEEITSIKYVVESPSDASFQPVGDKLTLEFELE